MFLISFYIKTSKEAVFCHIRPNSGLLSQKQKNSLIKLKSRQFSRYFQIFSDIKSRILVSLKKPRDACLIAANQVVCGCGTKLSHEISYDGGVADLGFCYADSRQTGSGYDSKTFLIKTILIFFGFRKFCRNSR